MEILIAEDEAQIAISLKKNFLDEGHNVMIAGDGEKALHLMDEIQFDILLLDWRMPKKNGLEVLKELRDRGDRIPVILLTALSDVSDKIDAFKVGADDYITKPFSFEEVLARIEAVNRRYVSSLNIMEFSGCSLDLMERKIISPTGIERLTEKEFELLKYLLENRGVIISKEDLCINVWDINFQPTTNLIEVTVKNLRRKLEDVSGKKFIKTIYGEGYLFISE